MQPNLHKFFKKNQTMMLFFGAFVFPTIFISVFVFAALTISNGQNAELGKWASKYNGLIPSWLSAITAIFGTFVGSLIFLQLHFSASQMKRERESKEYEYFKRLAEIDMMRVRRFVYNGEFENSQAEFKANLEKGINVNKALDVLRKSVKEISKRHEYEIRSGEYMQLDHIEYAINYYNFMCKMILDASISEKFGTQLGTANFKGFYRRVAPFIEARARHSQGDSYAIHFRKYVEFDLSPNTPPK